MDFLSLKNNVVGVLNEGIEFATKYDYKDVVESIDKSIEKLKTNELVVLVCGEMKRGKSSLLSAFLEEDDLFPINANVATNVVTIVRYGESEIIEVVLEKGDKFESKIIKREEIKDYVTEQGNVKNLKKVKYLYIKTPNQKLKNGLVFVDTPGVGSLNIDHSEITYGYLPNADVLLFVSDALSPLTELELKFLISAAQYCNNIIFPITKTDVSNNFNEIKESNMEKISQFTTIKKEDIIIIPVSSLLKLSYMKTKNPLLLKKSNYKELENVVWSTVNNKRANILFIPPLVAFSKQLLKIESSFKIQIESLKQNDEKCREMQEEFKKRSEERQKLLENSAEWRPQLEFELDKVFRDAFDLIKSKQQLLKIELSETLQNPMILEKLEDLAVAMNENLYMFTEEIKNHITTAVNDIINKTEIKLGLNISMDNSLIDSIQIEEDIDIIGDMIKQTKFNKTLTVGRNMALTGSGISAATGFAGGVIGAAIGLLGGPIGAIAGAKIGASIGAVIGTSKGLYDGIKLLKGTELTQVKNLYIESLKHKFQILTDMINSMQREMKHGLQIELNSQIKAQRNMLEKDIQEIQKNLSLNKTEAEQKVKMVKEAYSKLKAIESKTVNLINSIKKISERDIIIEEKNIQKSQVHVTPQKNNINDEILNSNGYFDF